MIDDEQDRALFNELTDDHAKELMDESDNMETLMAA